MAHGRSTIIIHAHNQIQLPMCRFKRVPLAWDLPSNPVSSSAISVSSLVILNQLFNHEGKSPDSSICNVFLHYFFHFPHITSHSLIRIICPYFLKDSSPQRTSRKLLNPIFLFFLVHPHIYSVSVTYYLLLYLSTYFFLYSNRLWDSQWQKVESYSFLSLRALNSTYHIFDLMDKWIINAITRIEKLYWYLLYIMYHFTYIDLHNSIS